MSKRTAATQPVQPRRWRILPRLSDVRIQSKLGLILLVPILAVVALAGIELVSAGQTLIDARRVDSTIKLSNRAGSLIEQLQAERLSAAQVMMTTSKSKRASLLNDYKRQNATTDHAVSLYSAESDTVKSPPTDLANSMRAIDNQLDSLSKVGRGEVIAQSDATVASVSFRYQVLISELLDLRQSVVKLTTSRPLSDELSANAALSQAKEFASQEQLSLLRVINDGEGFDNTSFETFLGTLTGQQSAYDAFNRTADDDQQLQLEQRVNGPHVQASTALETDARTAGLDRKLSISPKDWNAAMSERLGAIRSVEQDLDGTAAAHAQDEVNSVVRKVIIESAAGLLVLLVAIVLALLVARAMARSLRRLREGALRVAYEGLPQAVNQLRQSDALGNLSPDEIASQVGDPVQVRGRDEIGQVSEAFNVVHREAVRVAAEQAVLRASVATMFINLARRSQLLVDRLIGHLDRLEQGEEDPDRLAQLFQLDHLATRMRRNDENLLVLAGADSTRARREAAPLGDVLRAAQSEVEQYTRIEFGVVDRDVEVEATAVNDVVHLIAELLDNATAFSSPDTAVVVDARRVGDRSIVQIEDRGIGMSPDVLGEVNERLANPPLVDVAVSRMMGLVVVGRLASRLGIKIELRPGTDRGTVADVVLPSPVLVPVDRTRPASLPASAGPLALEPAAPAQRVPEPMPADPMPGVPYQPAGRDSLADAATGGHRQSNGMSGLPQRSPAAPPGDPQPNEPIRRSLFEPVNRRTEPAATEPPATPDQPRPEDDREPAEPTGFEDLRGHDPDATSVFDRPANFDAPPARFDRSTPDGAGAEPAPRRREPTRATAADLWGTPADPDESSAASTSRGLPRRATPDDGGYPSRPGTDADSGRGGRDGWPTQSASAAEFDDLTVETPQVPVADRWASQQATPANGAGPGQRRQAPTERRAPARAQGHVSGSGRLDSGAPESNTGAGAGQDDIIPRNVDDTMELPIFREVESAWFRTSPSKPRSGAAGARSASPGAGASSTAHDRRATGGADTVRPSAPARPAAASVRQQPAASSAVSTPSSGAGSGRGSNTGFSGAAGTGRSAARPSAAPRIPEVPSEGRPDIDPWQGAADRGWQAASAVASTEPPEEKTTSGLPKRRPMAQLVPGGVEEPDQQVTVRERSPEAVRGLLSAYHRGVQRGRTSGSPRVSSGSGHRSTGDGAGEEQEA